VLSLGIYDVRGFDSFSFKIVFYGLKSNLNTHSSVCSFMLQNERAIVKARFLKLHDPNTSTMLSMDNVDRQNLPRRKLLAYLVAIGIVVALITTTLMLSSTFSPNAKARANVRTLPIDEVPIGTLKIFHEGDFASIVVRGSDSEFSIFEARYNRNSVNKDYFIVPGRFECKNISIENERIVCSGLHTPSLEWHFDGTPIANAPQWVSDLKLLPYVVTNGLVRYGDGA